MTSNRWVMVTGSSSGIGRATARALALAGWNVGIHYRQSRDAAMELSRTIEQNGRAAFVLQADLGNFEAVGRLVDEAWERAGRLDAWVHLAGVDLLTGAEATLPFERKLELATRVDLWGTVLACRTVGARMRQAGGGAIVTVGWDQANTGMEGESGELFSAVKGGVTAFSRSLAKSLAPRVRVNCVAPGWIKTAWGAQASETWHNRVLAETPLGRWGEPGDVAGAIDFLLSDAARFVTGQTLCVNGGAVTS